MAISPIAKYPTRVEPATTEYPYGKAKNRTAPGNGTPFDEDLVNDIFGLLQAIDTEAGITPSGVPDNAVTSQRLQALKQLFGARVPTYAAARALDSSTLTDGQLVWIDGYAYPWRVKTGTVTDNSGMLLVFNDDSNRYLESTSPVVSVDIFTGTDTEKFVAARDFAGGDAVFVPDGAYSITSDISGNFYSFTDIVVTGGIINKIVNVRKKAKNPPYQPPSFALLPRFAGLKGWYTVLDTALYTYKAFPFFFVGADNLNCAGWSSGQGHGNSDEIRYAIIDPDTKELTEGVFYDLNTTTAYLDFLDDYLAEGEYVNFRSVYTVIKESGVLNLYVNSSIDVSGDTYSLWGTPYQYNGDWYTGAYRTAGGYNRTALLKSTDNMKTWTYVTLVASNSARTYNEAGFLNTSGANIISVVREDTTGLRDLHLVSSSDGGLNWTPAPGTLITPITDVKGTQPFLMQLSNGNVMLIAGKRTGSSGLDSGGAALNNEDITGVMYWISTDSGATWSDGVQIAPSWSTDCGNPAAKQLANGNVAVVFYVAQGETTTGTVGVEPSIIYLEFDPTTVNTSA